MADYIGGVIFGALVGVLAGAVVEFGGETLESVKNAHRRLLGEPELKTVPGKWFMITVAVFTAMFVGLVAFARRGG